MAQFPPDEASRDHIRAEVTEEYILRAMRSASNHMRSLRCQRGDHRCRNNGASCLCICHDDKTSFTMDGDRLEEAL